MNYFSLISINDLLLWITRRSPFVHERAACCSENDGVGWGQVSVFLLELKLSRNCILLLESFMIRADFLHIRPLRKPSALEPGGGHSLNEQWLAISPSHIDIDQWVQYKAEVSYRLSWLKVISQNISLVQILHTFLWITVLFIGGTKREKREDEIILSNDKAADCVVPSEVQVHHSEM